MGQRGVKRFLRDNKGKIQGPFEKGQFDTSAIAGRNLYTSVDVEVQQLAEKLLQHKIGSVVALNPKTGSIITMASSPGYNPNLLTGNQRRKTIAFMVAWHKSPHQKKFHQILDHIQRRSGQHQNQTGRDQQGT